MTDDERITEIEARLATRTPGEWFVNGSKVFSSVRPWEDIVVLAHRDSDAVLIASAPADLRYLLDRLRAVEAERDDALRRFTLHIDRSNGRDAGRRERIAALEAECKLHWEEIDRLNDVLRETHGKACTEVYAKYGRHAPYCLLDEVTTAAGVPLEER